MISKTAARTKAASIRVSLDAVHASLEDIPAGPEREAAILEMGRLHAKLNGVAHKLAEIFEDDVETFSGGTDKPEEP